MVDYSKWDRMDFSDSDEENEDESAPRVTSLEEPGKVTIGSDGSVEIGRSSLPSQPPTQSLPSLQPTADGIPIVSGGVSGDTVDISADATSQSSDPSQKGLDKVQRWRSQLTHNGGEHHCTVTTSDKREVKLPVYWSQDRHTVALRLGFPAAIFPTRGIRVRVKGALKYSDRQSAVGSGVMSGRDTGPGDESYGTVEIISLANQDQEETTLLTGELPRPIHLSQDEDEIDFEIVDNFSEGGKDEECKCNKLVTINMPKAVPMAGVVLWWDRPLVGYPQIDVSSIQERKNTNGGGNGGVSVNNEEKKQAFQKTWDEAHTMFREKMKTKEKMSIEVND